MEKGGRQLHTASPHLTDGDTLRVAPVWAVTWKLQQSVPLVHGDKVGMDQ